MMTCSLFPLCIYNYSNFIYLFHDDMLDLGGKWRVVCVCVFYSDPREDSFSLLGPLSYDVHAK